MDYKSATGTVFRDVMRDKPFDWCKLMLGDSSNLFYSMLVNLVKDSKPDLFHKCPYEGLVDDILIKIKKIMIFFEIR